MDTQTKRQLETDGSDHGPTMKIGKEVISGGTIIAGITCGSVLILRTLAYEKKSKAILRRTIMLPITSLEQTVNTPI